MSTANKYGDRYYGIRMTDGSIHMYYGETITLTNNGDIYIMGRSPSIGEPMPLVLVASGEWETAWAASVLDGSPVALEHCVGDDGKPM